MDLLRGRFGLGHVVFCDNYYSSPRLFLDLWELKVLAVGTCRKNRKGLPIFLKTKIVANQESFAMHTGPLTAVKYMDSNPVYILSTMFTSENVRHKDTVKPKCVKMYNKYMGGVDRTDQMVANAKSQMKTLKWWKKLFFHIISLSVLNSYIKYKGNVQRPMSNRDFRKLLVEYGHQLDPHPAPVPGRPKSQSLDRLTARHFPDIMEGRARMCVVCNPALRELHCNGPKRKKVPGHESTFHCPDCDVVLCITPCFRLFHSSEDYVLAYKRYYRSKNES